MVSESGKPNVTVGTVNVFAGVEYDQTFFCEQIQRILNLARMPKAERVIVGNNWLFIRKWDGKLHFWEGKSFDKLDKTLAYSPSLMDLSI